LAVSPPDGTGREPPPAFSCFVVKFSSWRFHLKGIFKKKSIIREAWLGFPCHYKIAFHSWFFIFWLDPKNETKKIKAVNK
jgi:hypothetical protein